MPRKRKQNAEPVVPGLEGPRRRQAMKDELLGGRRPGEVMEEQLAPDPPPPPAIDHESPQEDE